MSTLPAFRAKLRDLRSEPSREEREHEYAAVIAEAEAAHAAARAQADSILAAAGDTFKAARSGAEAKAQRHEARLGRMLAQGSHEDLKPLAATFLATFAPKDAMAIATKLREWHAEHLRVLGERPGYGSGVAATLGPRLWLVLASLMVDADPRCVAAFAPRGAGLHTVFSSAAQAALAEANRACLATPLDSVSLVLALQNLQRAVAAVAASAVIAGPNDARRFEANCFGGSREATEAEHAEIDRDEEATRVAAYDAERELVDRARNGEQIEGRDSLWHKAIRASRFAIGEIARL